MIRNQKWIGEVASEISFDPQTLTLGTNSCVACFPSPQPIGEFKVTGGI